MIESAEESEILPDLTESAEERIDSLVDRYYALHLTDLALAGRLVDEALDLAIALGNPALQARALCARAQYDRHHSNSAAAIEKLERARTLYATVGDAAGQGYAIGLIGTVHKSLGDSRSALQHQFQALELFEGSGDLAEKGGVLNDIGNAYKTLGDFTTALEYHLASLEIAIDHGIRRGEASALNNIGNIHYELGDLPAAADCYLRSLAIKEELGDPVGIGNSLGNLGLVYTALGEHDQAVEFHTRSLHRFRTCGDREGETNSLGNLATLWCTHGSSELALEFGFESLQLARQIGDREAECDSLRTIGNARHLEGENEAAVECLTEALSIAIELGVRPLEQKIHEALASALRDLGRPAAALEHLQRMYRIRGEVSSSNARRTISNRVMLFDLDKAKKEAEIERLRNVELARALEDLEKAQLRLVHAEKMAYIGHLTAGVTDQARHPIAAIDAALAPVMNAAAELLALGRRYGGRRDGPIADEILPADTVTGVLETILAGLTTIEEEATRTAAIVEGLRSFTRLDESSLKLASLHEGISALLTLVRNRCRGRIGIIFNAGSIPPVECYPGLVNQAVLAIVSEGIDRIDGRGAITIGTDLFGSTVAMTITCRSQTRPPGRSRGHAGNDATDSLAVTVAREIMQKHGGELVVCSPRPGDFETRLVLPIRQPRSARGSSKPGGGENE